MEVYDQFVQEVCQCVVVVGYEVFFVFFVQLFGYVGFVDYEGWIGQGIGVDDYVVVEVEYVVDVVQYIVVDYVMFNIVGVVVWLVVILFFVGFCVWCDWCGCYLVVMKVKYSVVIEFVQVVEQVMCRWQLVVGVGMLWLVGMVVVQVLYVVIEVCVDLQELVQVGFSLVQLQVLNCLLCEVDVCILVVLVVVVLMVVVGGLVLGVMFFGLDDRLIKVKVIGQVDGWVFGIVFILDNGQQWQVFKGEIIFKVSCSNFDIVVVFGIVGCWFLQVDEELFKVCVFCIC